MALKDAVLSTEKVMAEALPGRTVVVEARILLDSARVAAAKLLEVFVRTKSTSCLTTVPGPNPQHPGIEQLKGGREHGYHAGGVHQGH